MAGTMKEHMKERFGGGDNRVIHPPLPANLNIELNNTCNQKCEFCFAHGPHSQSKIKPAVMDFNFACSLLKQAAEKGIGRNEVGFYSEGEVFLYKRFSEIVAYAKKLGFRYTFVTSNGALATPDVLKEVVDAGLDSIRFSVNAADRETYRIVHGTDDFEQVLENIKWLHKYKTENNIKINTSISAVMTKRTIGDKAKISEVFGEYVDEILFIPVLTEKNELRDYDVDITEEFAIYDDKKIEKKVYKGCPIPFNTMYIDAEGKMFICCDTYFVPLRVADLHEDMDMEKAWNSELMVKYRKALLDKELDGTYCKNCIQIWGGAERLQME